MLKRTTSMSSMKSYESQCSVAEKPARSPKSCSLIEQPSVCQVIEKIVHSLNPEPSLHQDLVQEALLHLWRLERDRPDQTTSWYLQSCRFRLQHYLNAGRSVDSGKRRGGRIALPHDENEPNWFFGYFMTENQALDEASAQDLVSSLAPRLKPKERAVLNCLADGLSSIEIARKLKLSSPTVTKYRRKIAR